MNRSEVWKRVVIAALLLLLGDLAQAAAGTKIEAGIRLIGQAQYDDTLDATFSLGMAPDGSAWTRLQSGDLTVDKWATAAGDATIVLNYRSDRVTFALKSAAGYTVSRGRRSASFSPTDSNQDRRTAFRMLLVGSPAVRAFRAFTSAMERRDGEDTTAMISTMMDGALVAALDGDDGAVDRVGKRLERRMRAGARRAHGTTLAQYQFNDCVLAYERALLSSWNLYASCINTYSMWYYFTYAPICAFEFGIRSQQYVFQFISCMAIPH
ncbi:MAG TPA: hypothetical protein VH701_07815 [Vicinamibacterales bacterium]